MLIKQKNLSKSEVTWAKVKWSEEILAFLISRPILEADNLFHIVIYVYIDM